MNVNKDLFENMPVHRSVMKMALPTVLSMLAVVVYNMTDTFFVGQTGDPFQVAAVSLCNPVFMFVMAFSSIFGVGGSSAISRALGAGDLRRGSQISAFCFYCCLALGAVVTIVFWLCMPTILKLIGSSENTYGFAKQYLTWTCVFIIVLVFSNSMPNIIRSEGAAMHATLGMMTGIVTNIILDPIFITTLKLGCAGASIATGIGNLFTCMYFLIYLNVKKGKTVLSFRPSDFKAGDGIAKEVITVGLPSGCNNMLQSSAFILFNNFLASYGDMAVAAMGVSMRACSLVIMTQGGVAIGTQPLISYCYGARKMDRLKSILRFAMACTLTIGIVLSGLYFIFSRQIIQLFVDDEEVIRYGVTILRVTLISTPILGVLFCCMNALQGMKRAVLSFIVSISRQGLLFLPSVLILNAVFGFYGLISATVVADYLSIILAGLMFIYAYRKEKRKFEAEAELAARS